MIAIKEIAKKATVESFNKRFELLGSRAEEKITGKIYYCPYDLGFNFTMDDCKNSNCKNCWNEAIESLMFKSQKIVNISEIRVKAYE